MQQVNGKRDKMSPVCRVCLFSLYFFSRAVQDFKSVLSNVFIELIFCGLL